MTPTLQDHLVERLRLSIGDAARVTGVSVRQLSYWTKKGLVRALGSSGKKRYDFLALERIALIKRHLTEGYALTEAARLAEHALHERRLTPMRRRIAAARVARGR
jgi:DNA-binding transcriptional MerR regulator